ncbi:30S ribosomal protein S10 [Candidatus Tremblaya princeps]|uniref:Small ribosomal subunit protein uS10 n=1 Tax=Tremblaya princeps TaxID=189385 RepID=A0A143WNR6_TREPR|nr:30S ribosomal protein S10 [Candidatus Tremblaya princeps]
MRLVLKSFSPLALRDAAALLARAIATTSTARASTVPLPTRRRRFDLLRSPHIDKRAMDQMEIRTHKRLIHVPHPTARTAEALMSADVPPGVSVLVRP